MSTSIRDAGMAIPNQLLRLSTAGLLSVFTFADIVTGLLYGL